MVLTWRSVITTPASTERKLVLSMGLARALADRVRQAEALTQHLVKQARQTNHRNVGPTVAANSTMFVQMTVWQVRQTYSSQGASAKPEEEPNAKPAEEFQQLRAEVEELARRIDVLLLEAEP
jgi:hypothetical protein